MEYAVCLHSTTKNDIGEPVSYESAFLHPLLPSREVLQLPEKNQPNEKHRGSLKLSLFFQSTVLASTNAEVSHSKSCAV